MAVSLQSWRCMGFSNYKFLSVHWINCSANQNYQIIVQAECTPGNYSSNTVIIQATDPESVSCADPTGLAVSGTPTQTSATITWTAGTATAWNVRINGGTAIPVNAATHTFNSLTCGTAYTAEVQADCGSGNVSNWVSVSFNTAACDVEPSVANGTANVDSNCTSVDFTATITNAGTGSLAAIEYGFVYGTTAGVNIANGQHVVATATGTNLTATATGLTINTLYYYNVYAKKAGDTYVYGTEATFGPCNSLEDVSATWVSVNIYPNPATHTATLSVEGLREDAQITITDLTGKVIGTSIVRANQKELTIDVKSYAAGVYYVRVLNSDISKTQKLIVNK